MKNFHNGTKGLLAAAILLTATLNAPAYAQQATSGSAKMAQAKSGISVPQLPTNVLLFPAVIIGDGSTVAPATPSTKLAQEIVTDAVRRFLIKGGVGVVVYSSRLPSIQRAVSEGSGVKADDAAKGPGDDTRLAQKLAEVTGAEEYITVSVDSYSYDAKTRRASFNLSIERKAADGSPIASAAEKATGDAPADVAGPRQQESATARAAETVAERSVIDVFPQSATVMNPPKVEVKKKKKSTKGWIIPIITLGGLLAFPR